MTGFSLNCAGTERRREKSWKGRVQQGEKEVTKEIFMTHSLSSLSYKRCREVKKEGEGGCEVCCGEPFQELEAELEEAQLQILHLEKILGRAVGREKNEEMGNGGSSEGRIEGQLENGWREAMRVVRRKGGDGVWHRKYQEIETVL